MGGPGTRAIGASLLFCQTVFVGPGLAGFVWTPDPSNNYSLSGLQSAAAIQ